MARVVMEVVTIKAMEVTDEMGTGRIMDAMEAMIIVVTADTMEGIKAEGAAVEVEGGIDAIRARVRYGILMIREISSKDEYLARRE